MLFLHRTVGRFAIAIRPQASARQRVSVHIPAYTPTRKGTRRFHPITVSAGFARRARACTAPRRLAAVLPAPAPAAPDAPYSSALARRVRRELSLRLRLGCYPAHHVAARGARTNRLPPPPQHNAPNRKRARQLSSRSLKVALSGRAPERRMRPLTHLSACAHVEGRAASAQSRYRPALPGGRVLVPASPF